MADENEKVVQAAAKEQQSAVTEGAKAAANGPVDHVLAVSRHADGTPAQTPGFKSVAPDATADISKNQLREQAVSTVDYEIRSRLAAGGEAGGPVDDPLTKSIRDAQENAAGAAEKRAASEKVEG